MIEISSLRYIGRGNHRAVYEHPDDPHCCIKVQFAVDPDAEKEFARELRYYEILEGRGIDWEMIPRFHGRVETSMGMGSVFDLVRDSDGAVSSTLRAHLNDPALTRDHFYDIAKAMWRFHRYLMDQGIATMELNSENILVRRDGGGGVTPMLVDNIGASDFIPLSLYLPSFSRRKLRRKWRRFEEKILREHPDNEWVAQLFDSHPSAV